MPEFPVFGEFNVAYRRQYRHAETEHIGPRGRYWPNLEQLRRKITIVTLISIQSQTPF